MMETASYMLSIDLLVMSVFVAAWNAEWVDHVSFLGTQDLRMRKNCV
jgi:hypothetical protein